MSGFQFRETMSGSYHLDASPDRERAMSFTIGAYAPSLLQYLRDKKVQIQGEVDIEGFAEHRPLRGTMQLDPLVGRRVVYEFTSTDDQDRTFRFVGQKNIELLHFADTITNLPGEIFDAAGRRIGEARLRFDARSDLGKFLGSWKPLRYAY